MPTRTIATIVLFLFLGCRPHTKVEAPTNQPPTKSASSRSGKIIGSKGSPNAPMIFVDAAFTPGEKLLVFRVGVDGKEMQVGSLEVIEYIEGNTVCRLLTGLLPEPGDVVRSQ
jgi:hypothetical protein